MAEVLVEVARRRCAWQGRGGSFAFPCLFTGLAVIATGVTVGRPGLIAGRGAGASRPAARRTSTRTGPRPGGPVLPGAP
ncbi:hypothetical protein ABTZ58_01320 [Streptomyces sp. NPDC094143]|uniref:hypothetical protein n=1 Tax=Streptomyces sp. NPDC094143 TaxID=3155310 RepID=UPI0033304474